MLAIDPGSEIGLMTRHSLVLFQVTTSQIWRGFELIPFVFLGVIGGVFGYYFIRFNIAYAKFRASDLADRPILEVTVVSLLTALVSYLIVYAKYVCLYLRAPSISNGNFRVPTSELVANLFSDCSTDPYSLCDRDHQSYVVFLLL